MSVVRFLALLVVCMFGLVTAAYAQCGILLQDDVPPSDGSGHRTLFEWDFDGPGPLEPELLTGADGGRVMAFNGTRWRQVGPRLTGQPWGFDATDPIVFQFLDFRGELHAIAATRTTAGAAGGLFRWNGNEWVFIPWRGVGCGTSGVSGWMGAGTVWYDRIVIVGQYLTCDNRRTWELSWDGTSWAALAPTPTQTNSPFSTSVFATSDGRLLMGGSSFGYLIHELVDGIWVSRAEGTSISTFRSKFQEIDGELYASITASQVTGQGSTLHGVLKEDPQSGVWNAWPIPSLPSTPVSGNQLAKFGDTWYLAATLAGASEEGAVFRRDGVGLWTRVTQYGSTPPQMRDIAQYKDSLIAIGADPNLRDCQFASRVYQADLTEPVSFYTLPSRLVAQQQGIERVVDTSEGLLAYSRNYFPGYITAASYPQVVRTESCYVSNLTFAYFDGADWRNSPEPLQGRVESLFTYQNQILAFGSFTRAGQRDISPHVARWTGGRWESFTVGLPSAAHSAVIHQGQLYATTTAVQSTNTLRFNGTQWVSAAQSLPQTEAVLMSNGTALYALRSPYLYRLVGDLWVNIAAPTGLGYTRATVFNGVLYAAFSGGGTSPVKRLENNQWVDVGSFPTPPTIRSLASHDGVLYAGLGNSGGSSMAPLMAHRNGTWERAIPNIPPRAGLQPPPTAIDSFHSSGDILHLVGTFTYIGGLTAESWIRFYTGAPRILTQPVPSEVSAGQTGYFSIEPEVYHDPLQTYQWHRNGVPLSNGLTSNGSTIAGATTPYLSITNISAADLGLYTVKITNGCGITESNPGELRLTPPYCPADFDQDGSVTGSDVEAFFLTWETGAPEADINLDGGTDGTDIQAFFTLWEAGGC